MTETPDPVILPPWLAMAQHAADLAEADLAARSTDTQEIPS